METKERGWGKKVVVGQRDISKAIKSFYNKHGAMIYEQNQSVLNLHSVENIKTRKENLISFDLLNLKLWNIVSSYNFHQILKFILF